MPKLITIEASDKAGKKLGEREVLFPLNLQEALAMLKDHKGPWGSEAEFFGSAVRQKAVEIQNEIRVSARPASSNGKKPGKSAASQLGV